MRSKSFLVEHVLHRGITYSHRQDSLLGEIKFTYYRSKNASAMFLHFKWQYYPKLDDSTWRFKRPITDDWFYRGRA